VQEIKIAHYSALRKSSRAGFPNKCSLQPLAWQVTLSFQNQEDIGVRAIIASLSNALCLMGPNYAHFHFGWSSGVDEGRDVQNVDTAQKGFCCPYI